MVEPLTAIQKKVKSFLEEWPGHPGLMKIMGITETLLDVPPCTPLSKVTSLNLKLNVSFNSMIVIHMCIETYFDCKM